MANRLNSVALCLLAGFCAPALIIGCGMRWASAHGLESRFRAANANALASSDTSAESKAGARLSSATRLSSAKGPYYVDFRARTAASWGHAFVWFGKTGERAVEVAGLTPAGDTASYIMGYFTPVPSETGASYGDLDPQYLTAHYKVYLNEQDAGRVFAYIKNLQASSPVWNAETENCTGFIGNIAEFMGLKTPYRWERPEQYVNDLKAMNGGREIVRLSAEQ